MSTCCNAQENLVIVIDVSVIQDDLENKDSVTLRLSEIYCWRLRKCTGSILDSSRRVPKSTHPTETDFSVVLEFSKLSFNIKAYGINTTCTPAPLVPLAHTPVSRYSTRHSCPKSQPLSPHLRNHRPTPTTIIYTALLLSARALLRLCSRCRRQLALLIERGHRVRPLALPYLRHHTHLQQQAHRHHATLQEFTYLGHITRHASFPALPVPAESHLTSQGPRFLSGGPVHGTFRQARRHSLHTLCSHTTTTTTTVTPPLGFRSPPSPQQPMA